jgi:hypothetical protein
MSDVTKPNAFLFKMLIENQYRICLCPRIDGQWNEKDIVYIENETFKNMFDGILDDNLFSILFVSYEEDPTGVGGIKLLNTNSKFMRSDKDTSQSLYHQGLFFSTIEKGYQQFYEQSESSREGQQATASEQESV